VQVNTDLKKPLSYYTGSGSGPRSEVMQTRAMGVDAHDDCEGHGKGSVATSMGWVDVD
jgi:hypothetical protein